MSFIKLSSRAISALFGALSLGVLACDTGGIVDGELPPADGSLETDIVLDGVAHPVVLDRVDDTYLLEGDMIVGPELVPALRDADVDIQQSYSVTRQDLLWPGGKVPYTIDPALPNKWRVRQAIAHWEARTAIRFIPRTNQRDHVRFRPGSGCRADLGRKGGRQHVYLASHCNLALTIHEIGHTVGLFHEHTRPDRNSHVRVLWNNVPASVASNYYVHGAGGSVGRYDPSSIMHYGSYEFTLNGYATLLTRPNNGTIPAIRHKSGLSAGDVRVVDARYGASVCPWGDGYYCGGNGVGGQTGSLYWCAGRTLSRVQRCAAGCYAAPPGQADSCRACPYGDGYYCGNTSGVGGASGSLYRCEDGALSHVSTCANGCYVAPPGEPDACR